jgi:hypothetical protein
MADPKAIALAIAAYLREHPEELLRVAKNLIAFRFGVPLAALRWLAAQPRRKGPSDVEIEAVPPGVRVLANVDLMGTPIRAGATLYIEGVVVNDSHFSVEIRLSDVTLTLLDDTSQTPVAALLKSGALDLSRPGNLVAYMPKRPAMLVEARDDRIVLDLLRHPRLAKSRRLRKLAALLEPLISVSAVGTDYQEHLHVELRPLPRGLRDAAKAVRERLS